MQPFVETCSRLLRIDRMGQHAAMKIQQIRYFVSVYQEGSFSAAAQRENATQSGISTHIRDLEHRVGAPLFDRGPNGVTPTPVGDRFYAHALSVMRALSDLEAEIGALAQDVTGSVRVGLMPSFTRAALAPALTQFTRAYPRVEIAVVEAYSAALTDMVARAQIDFAIVPEARSPPQIEVQPLARDAEFLVTRPGMDRPHLSPVDLAALGPLELVLPGPANARRASIEGALAACGATVARRLELDAMMGTLDLVARSNFVTILPGVLVAPDRDGHVRSLHPIAAPALDVGYMLIRPAVRSLSQAADLFAQALVREIELLILSMRDAADGIGNAGGARAPTAAARPVGA